MVNLRKKRSESSDQQVPVEHIQRAVDLLVFNIILGSFGALVSKMACNSKMTTVCRVKLIEICNLGVLIEHVLGRISFILQHLMLFWRHLMRFGVIRFTGLKFSINSKGLGVERNRVRLGWGGGEFRPHMVILPTADQIRWCMQVYTGVGVVS